jgi:hypothetical protein
VGRPINKKYFGNRNTGDPLSTADNYGIGGAGVTAVALGTAGSAYSQGLTATFAAPGLPGAAAGIPGAVQATLSVAVYSANGAVSGYTVTDGGSGYLSAPAVTLVQPGNVNLLAGNVTASGSVLTVSNISGISVGMRVIDTTAGGNIASAPRIVTSLDTANLTVTVSGASIPNGNVVADDIRFYDAGTSAVAGSVTMTTVGVNAGFTFPTLSISAYVPGGSAKVGDIIKQESKTRFRVVTADGTAVCKLTTNSSVASGEIRLSATDSHSNTYYIRKISGRTATVWPSNQTGGGSYEFGDVSTNVNGTRVRWNVVAAVDTQSVVITTI